MGVLHVVGLRLAVLFWEEEVQMAIDILLCRSLLFANRPYRHRRRFEYQGGSRLPGPLYLHPTLVMLQSG